MVLFRRIGWGGAAFLVAVCVLLSGAVRYNLSAVSSAVSEMPVTVVIDAGHGGEDGGAVGLSGSKESRINLEIALKLEQLLRFCGFRTEMIRTDDTAVYSGDCGTITEKKVSDLKNRVEMVNRIVPAVLISVHQNHFSEEKYSGAQVFYANTDGSKALAMLTQQALRSGLDPDNQRQCKPASSVYLMEQIRCTGILVECGFLSNREEELRLQQPEYQKKIVCALVGALTQFTEASDVELEV